MRSSIVAVHRQRRRRRAALDQLPDLVELLVIALRSGATPTTALEAVAGAARPPLGNVLDDVILRMHRGHRFADALGVFTEQLGPVAAAFVDAIATADRYGLPLAPALDRVADDVRAERRRRAEQQARTLPVKLAFPLVVFTLPSFVLLAIVPALLGAISTLRGDAP